MTSNPPQEAADDSPHLSQDSCPILPFSISYYYNRRPFEDIYHEIGLVLQSQPYNLSFRQTFQHLINSVSNERKTTEFYCSLLFIIFSNPNFSLDLLQFILSYNSTILSFQDQYGNNLFHYLIVNSFSIYILQYLFQYKSSCIFQRNYFDETCLHLAVQATPISLETIQLLLYYDPNAIHLPSKSGKLPIHYLFRRSFLNKEHEAVRDACFELLIKQDPTSVYNEITEKITRINLQTLTSPTSIIETPEGPITTAEAAPRQPFIVFVERKWSPYSEANRKSIEENNDKDLRLIERIVTSHMIFLLHDRKYPQLSRGQGRTRCCPFSLSPLNISASLTSSMIHSHGRNFDNAEVVDTAAAVDAPAIVHATTSELLSMEMTDISSLHENTDTHR